MKCGNCGAQNFRSSGPCRMCGKPLADLGAPPATGATAYSSTLGLVMTTDEVARRYRGRYDHDKDANTRSLESVQELLALARKPEFDVHAMIQRAAETMHQQFRLRWIAIGLRGSDGAYRYDALVGFREDVAEKRRNQSFRKSDFLEDSRYKGWSISNQTRLYLEEDKPYSEGAEATFNRPMLMKARRRSTEDSLEADYIDIHIYGLADDLLGWIESSGTITGKLPDISTIRWMEAIASVIGAALMRRRVY